MGFGKNNKGNNFKKKGKLKTQIRLLGVGIAIIGFLVSLYDLQNNNLAAHQQNMIISVGLVVIGMIMILQKKLLIGLKNTVSNMNTPRCNCCKCTNCYRNHNHWTHD